MLLNESERQSKKASNFVFYVQSGSMVISGRDNFCHHTLNVKNVYVLKLVYLYIKKEKKKKKSE